MPTWRRASGRTRPTIKWATRYRSARRARRQLGRGRIAGLLRDAVALSFNQTLMEDLPKPKPVDEQSLVKLYSEITGAGDATARGVFMYIETPSEETPPPSKVSPLEENGAAPTPETPE
jgi:hypothetical protein